MQASSIEEAKAPLRVAIDLCSAKDKITFERVRQLRAQLCFQRFSCTPARIFEERSLDLPLNLSSFIIPPSPLVPKKA